jgi:hypothetical protein
LVGIRPQTAFTASIAPWFERLIEWICSSRGSLRPRCGTSREKQRGRIVHRSRHRHVTVPLPGVARCSYLCGCPHRAPE